MPEDRRHTSSVRKLAAIMFTDILGYTALMGADEDKAFDVLKKNQDIHNKLIQQHNGTLIKEMGDGMLVSFHLASDAVRCAIEIQKACKEQAIPLKIGIHEGEMVFAGKDVLGDSVNIASRLQDDAEEGSISISSSVYKDVKNKADINTKYVGEKAFKNVDEPVKMYKVLLEGEGQKPIDIESKNGSSKYLYYLLGGVVIIIAALLVWNYLPQRNTVELEKSIAVLPFKNLSNNPDDQYLPDGVMDAILNNLQRIEELSVRSRTSAEQYRDPDRNLSEIGRALNANYILEGSFQKIGEQANLTVQLIIAETDEHIWAEEYNRDWSDVFKIQSEIAQTIARELYAAITPEEKEIIETIPTRNLTAYDFFLRARDEHTKYWDNGDKESLEKAITLYHVALENDSTYAQAYTGLALAYWNKHGSEMYLSEDYMDSALVLANTSLLYNDQLEEAYFIRGLYHFTKEEGYEKALLEFDKAIQINPNYLRAYWQRGYIYSDVLGNFVDGLKDLHMAASLATSKELPYYLRFLSLTYLNIGFSNKAIIYQKEALRLDGDSAQYYGVLAVDALTKYNYEGFLNLAKKRYEIDSTSVDILKLLIVACEYLGYDQEAYIYAKILAERIESENLLEIDIMHRIGYAYMQVGKQEEAQYYFDEMIRYCLESIRLGRGAFVTSGNAYFDLAATYAFLGEKEKAYQYLEQIDKKDAYDLIIVMFIKSDYMYNSIKEEERFKNIVKKVEAKYQKEHERVRVWLEEANLR